MHVISRAVNNQRGTAHLANNASEISEEIGADFGSYERLSTLGAEDQVNHEIASGMSQSSFAPSELDISRAPVPTARAVGCILSPLRG
jgi:hypothetical protein